jgi:hypothetical protein
VASELDVWNAALAELGQHELSSIEDPGTVARACRAMWPAVRTDLMRRHAWNCCVKRATLAPLTEAPEHSWLYQALLPEDYLRMLSFGLDDCPEHYQIEAGRVLADTTTFRLRYVADKSAEEWDANMAAAAVGLMRARLAYPVTKSTSLRDAMVKEAAIALREAKALDGQENPSEDIAVDSPLLNARFGRVRAWER